MDNTITVNLNDQPEARLCIGCMVCDEPIPLTEWEEVTLRYGRDIHNKVCDKCKAAILYTREQMEQK